MQRSPRGHAVRPHTADVRIEAWGPTAPACLEEAIAALVATGVDVDGAVPSETRRLSVGPGPATERLVLVLEEVLTLLDVEGVVPCAARVQRCDDDGVEGELDLVPLSAVPVVGPGAKGISHGGLRFERTGDGWACEAVVDV